MNRSIRRGIGFAAGVLVVLGIGAAMIVDGSNGPPSEMPPKGRASRTPSWARAGDIRGLSLTRAGACHSPS